MYSVVWQQRAIADLNQVYDRIAEEAPVTARRWYRRFRESVDSLKAFPQRCGSAPEATQLQMDLRQLIVRSYRALFTIVGDRVHVLSIRSPGQDAVGPDDL